MAEDSDLEKTEPASPRRLEKAREEGDIPRSRELATFTVLMAATAGLWLGAQAMITQLKQLLTLGLVVQVPRHVDWAQQATIWARRCFDLLLVFVPFTGWVLLAALASPLLIGGWMFHAKALGPDFGKLNPVRGLTNMVSQRSLVELLKALGKTLLVGIAAWAVIAAHLQDMLALSLQAPETSIANSGRLLLICLTVMVGALAVIALIDAPYQMWSYAKKLMMTRQEIRDEAKESEGNPEIKAKIRAQQRDMARKRMMAQVPSADVVVTNPTHYAVALKYPENATHAPMVVAKGVDDVAARIREIAQENGVVLVEAPALARALYQHAELEHEIPRPLYTAVAQVLAYVFQLRTYRTQGGREPRVPEQVSVPDGMDPQAATDPTASGSGAGA